MFEKVRAPAYPTDAEKILCSDYSFPTKGPSKFIEGLIVETGWRMHCPRCRFEMEEIEHADVRQCVDCGLMMQVYGNLLYIWEAPSNLSAVREGVAEAFQRLGLLESEEPD